MICAGLYDVWHGPDDEVLYTYTILTTDASKKLEWLHDRMPLILRNQDAQKLWLNVDDKNSVQ